jgi:hypothetical protein
MVLRTMSTNTILPLLLLDGDIEYHPHHPGSAIDKIVQIVGMLRNFGIPIGGMRVVNYDPPTTLVVVVAGTT